ncbi:MAG: DedA family protein [Rhodothermales bacterium]
MSELGTDILEWMTSLPAVWAYATILVISYGENVVPPIPGDMVVVFGGYLVGVGRLDFFLVVILSTIGGALGFMTMYAIGYKIGDAVMDPLRLRWIPKGQIARAQRWLEKWGYGIVAMNRFLSGLRSVISLTVGMAHTEPWITALFATLSSLVWTALIAYGGFAVGDNWQLILVYLRDYGRIVLALLVVAALVQLVRWYARRRKS